MMLARKVLLFFACVVILLVVIQVGKIALSAGKLKYRTTPFQRNLPNAPLKILFVGDSTAMGTGAARKEESVAGWFGQEFPTAHIRVKASNGLKFAGLRKSFYPVAGEMYAVTVLQIGANDVMRLTPLKHIERDLRIVLERAQVTSWKVVIMHSGNIGAAPIFIWPFNWILTERTRAVRALYQKVAKERGALYVDLFAETKKDPFLKDIAKFYAPDRLHPSGAGYRWWYENIRKTLNDAGVVLRPQ